MTLQTQYLEKESEVALSNEPAETGSLLHSLSLNKASVNWVTLINIACVLCSASCHTTVC